jgi:hypothetical protein
MRYRTEDWQGSIIDLRIAARAPELGCEGIREVRCVDEDNGAVYIFSRQLGETERDFMVQALAAARGMGATSVRFDGCLPVPAKAE